LYEQSPDIRGHLALVERLEVLLRDPRRGIQYVGNIAGKALLEDVLRKIELLALVTVADGALQEFVEIIAGLVGRKNQFRLQRPHRFAPDDLAELEKSNHPCLVGGTVDHDRRIGKRLDEHDHVVFVHDLGPCDRGRQHVGITA
jgi:hypothetical protein